MFRVPISVFALLFLQSVMAQNFTGESVEYDPVGNRFFTSDDGTSIQQPKQQPLM